jgi:hypothetical protein
VFCKRKLKKKNCIGPWPDAAHGLLLRAWRPVRRLPGVARSASPARDGSWPASAPAALPWPLDGDRTVTRVDRLGQNAHVPIELETLAPFRPRSHSLLLSARGGWRSLSSGGRRAAEPCRRRPPRRRRLFLFPTPFSFSVASAHALRGRRSGAGRRPTGDRWRPTAAWLLFPPASALFLSQRHNRARRRRARGGVARRRRRPRLTVAAAATQGRRAEDGRGVALPPKGKSFLSAVVGHGALSTALFFDQCLGLPMRTGSRGTARPCGGALCRRSGKFLFTLPL